MASRSCMPPTEMMCWNSKLAILPMSEWRTQPTYMLGILRRLTSILYFAGIKEQNWRAETEDGPRRCAWKQRVRYLVSFLKFLFVFSGTLRYSAKMAWLWPWREQLRTQHTGTTQRKGWQSSHWMTFLLRSWAKWLSRLFSCLFNICKLIIFQSVTYLAPEYPACRLCDQIVANMTLSEHLRTFHRIAHDAAFDSADSPN